jgi:hypothetical protein
MATMAVDFVPFLLFGGLGAWLLATGRHLWIELPRIPDGWRLRAFGLACCVAAVYFGYRVFDGRVTPDAVIGAYLGLVIAVFLVFDQRRKAKVKDWDAR